MTVKHVPGKTKKEGEVVYIKDAILIYPSVQRVKDKAEADKREEKDKRHFEVQVFVSKEDREILEDTVLINKQIFEVNKDKNKKRKLKYPLKDAEGEDTAYADLKGYHGLSLTLNEYNKAGKKNKLVVVDSEGNVLKDDVGNGSKGHIKLWGYRNQEDLLNVQLKIIKVTDLVPYEGGSNGGVEDDELGVNLSADELAGGDADFDGIEDADPEDEKEPDNGVEEEEEEDEF